MASIKYKTEDGFVSIPMTVPTKTNEENGNGIGTCSTSSGTALTVSLIGYELVQNGFVAVTFENDVPANATLNINSKGAKPIYYKGSAIEADVIKADDTVMFAYDGTNYVVTSLGGGGGAEAIFEHLIVSLTGNQIDSATDLIGATIVVTNTDTEEELLNTTWQGDDVDLLIFPNINYSVEVGNVDGYATPSSKTHESAMGTTRLDIFTYQAELVTVTCTADDGASVAGKTVTIDGTQFTLDATGVAISKVAIGKTYTVAQGSWGTYDAMSRTYTADSLSRSVNLEWSSDAVDFELPSGIKWRRYCVGANSTNDPGYLFSWGNIIPGSESGSEVDSNYANTPGGRISAFSSGDATYDAARAILGGNWRIPTQDEYTELSSRIDMVKDSANGFIKLVSKKDSSKIVYMKILPTYPSLGNFFIRFTNKNYEIYGNYSGTWSGDMTSQMNSYARSLAVK